MMTRLIMLGVLAAMTPAQAQTTAKSKGGATPEEAVALMVKAAKAGDVDGTFNLLVDEQAKPLKDWFKTQTALAASMNAHVDALDAAFGKDPASPVKKISFDVKEELSRGISGIKVVGEPTRIDDVTVSLATENTVPGPDGKPILIKQTIKSRKTDSGWKLDLEEARADFPAAVTFMKGLSESLDRTTKGVKDGSIKDRAAAMTESQKDVPKNLPGNVPLPRFLTQPR